MTYYGAFYKSALYCLLTRTNAYLLRWVHNKYRRLRGRTKAQKAWIGVTQRHPRFFAHWTWINMPPTAG
jgi:RNA-directed DNA polymerase